MNPCTFYQLLDRELPSLIEEATTLIASHKRVDHPTGDPFDKTGFMFEKDDYLYQRNLSLKGLYPMQHECSAQSDCSERRLKINGFRDSLGKLTLAYAITSHEPFAELAIDLIKKELVNDDLFADDWTTTYDFEIPETDVLATSLAFVEIVRSLELLRGLGRLKSFHLKEVSLHLVKRLNGSLNQDYWNLGLLEGYAWTLEVVTVGLFLDLQKSLDSVGPFFQNHLTESLFKMIERYSEGDNSFPTHALAYCLECHFAISHGMDMGNREEGALVQAEINRLERLFGFGWMESLQKGAWVRESVTPKFETLIRETTLLLISYDIAAHSELNHSIFGPREKFSEPNMDELKVITQPLLWTDPSEWGYKPLSDSLNSGKGFFIRV